MILKYEEEIMIGLYNHQIIGNRYRALNMIERQINWRRIQTEHNVRKKFASVMKKLKNKGYVDDHGKSGEVYALSEFGVYYVMGIQ